MERNESGAIGVAPAEERGIVGELDHSERGSWLAGDERGQLTGDQLVPERTEVIAGCSIETGEQEVVGLHREEVDIVGVHPVGQPTGRRVPDAENDQAPRSLPDLAQGELVGLEDVVSEEGAVEGVRLESGGKQRSQ